MYKNLTIGLSLVMIAFNLRMGVKNMNETLIRNIGEQCASTSSIGPSWPSGEASFSRIKGFFPILINDHTSFRELTGSFSNDCGRIDSIGMDGNPITRIQYRAIVEADFLRRHARDALFRDNIEAILRLQPNSHLGEEPLLCYISQNSGRRMAHLRDLMDSWSNYRKVVNKTQVSYSQCISRATRGGYSIQIFDNPQSRNQNPALLSDLTNLYSAFGWNQNEVRALLNNPDNILGVGYDNSTSRIVSAGLAEMAAVDLNYTTEPFRMVELTEAATDASCGGKGLYAAVGALLIRHVLDRSLGAQIIDGEADLVFGESNSLEPAILAIAVRQGREMSPEVCREFGFSGRGLLISQVPITSRFRRRGAYNHLFPSGMHRDQLYLRHGK